MNNRIIKPLGILFLALYTSACIEPYNPKLKEFQSFLVIDALLTDEDTSNYVRLSRTFEGVDDNPEMVADAYVTIKDDLGNVTVLSPESKGIYKTDKKAFKGLTGRSYSLYIRTSDGTEYESEQCLMQEASDIDAVYFEKSRELNDKGEYLEGIRAYIDANDMATGSYYRWTCKEYWEFNVLYPKLYNFGHIEDSIVFEEVQDVRKTCWKENKSNEIIIQTIEPGSNGLIEKKPVLFIPAALSDRLLVQYCVEVSQYSMSSEQYQFWKQMKQVNESGGDIFDKPPFSINSNIHCLTNPKEQVLGYFQVSGSRYKRCYITRAEVDEIDLDLPYFDCELIELGPGDPQPVRISDPVTFDKIYSMYTWLGYTFIGPRYNFGGSLERLAFTKSKCADCTLTGSINPPSFWIDLD